MKILKISGKNLASLAGDFCVDFEREPLASSGLFAISGPTGAGKSTLLDALCLALYDATPRLLKQARGASYLPDVGSDVVSAQDPRTLLRRGSAEAHAEVDFIGNDDLRYRARWSVRRSRSKAAGALQKSTMTLHLLPDLAALGGTKSEVADEIEKRIGLSFEQFTRAVLLAQNEFSAFLKTEENERGELLETLTGSTIYSIISRRAFERYKLEQEAMRQLGMRLAEHAPMAPEARAQVDAAGRAADEALAALDAARAALEVKLRWRQQLDKLQRSEEQAGAALALARAALDNAGPRKLRLATIDAAQSARPLLAEAARLGAETAALGTATEAAAAALRCALVGQEQARAALTLATTGLQAAEQAQRDAAPLLDQAKTQDARIETLAPSHAAAAQAHQAARLEQAQALAALEAKDSSLHSLRAQSKAGAAWLLQHLDHESLAAAWPRWDTLLTQAGNVVGAQRRDADALAIALAAQQAADKSQDAAAGAFTAISAQLSQLETARQHAMSVLATFDGEQLRRRRQALDTRREHLASAEQTWTELGAARTNLAHLRRQADHLSATQSSAQAALNSSLAELAPLGAALAQAERSLKAAELACADSVEDLRSRLVQDEPCPVCGSAEHPYHHQNAGLHDMLASLQSEVERCRLQVQDAHSLQAAQRATAAASAAQLLATNGDLSALEASLERISAAWDHHPLAAEAVDSAWFAAQKEQLAAGIGQLDAQEMAMREATRVRDAAQIECDAMSARHARQHELLAAARSAHVQASAAHDALASKQAGAAQMVDALLAELNGAFAGRPDWQRHWRDSPAQFHSAREAEVRQWREQSLEQSSRAGKIALLESERIGAAERSVKAQRALDSAQAAFDRLDADIAALRAKRQALFDGRPAAHIEQELDAAIKAARAHMSSQQAASHKAAQDETHARATLAHVEARAAVLGHESLDAEQRLAEWIAQYRQRHPDLDAIPGKEALGALLAKDAAAIADERAALQALDAALAGASTVLAERRSQRELHAAAGAADESETLDALSSALETLATQRTQAHESAATFKVQIAQDDLRRSSAHSMMAAIDKQQLIERRWGQLNELIGSADGKKFRNYAQQFTLDVLLGYANSHLHHLARRYRLERVASSAGPSLGLMVRDQDMGGEVRSVNSLSGGESFLVSLALALGLASLSSNRVRVESLFIDEGFGSLDSDTLRVAMDALDGLQSMGRKVGVISHVQEMTERIACKILVQPAGGGTSCVTVE